MYKIIVVDDEDRSAEELTELLERYAAANGLLFSVRRFKNGLEFLEGYELDSDIVFMDTDMPMMDGLAAARKLRQIDPVVTLVFTAPTEGCAVEGYEVDAVDYLVRPFKFVSFCHHFERILARSDRKIGRTVILTTNQGAFCMPIASVYYVEISGHKIVWHTKQGLYNAYGSIKELEERLPAGQFFRCNQCYLVNLRHVARIGAETVSVAGTELQMSRPKKKPFARALFRYRKGGDIYQEED